MSQRPHKAYPIEMAQFHSPDYVEFLQRINPENKDLFPNEMARCKFCCLFTNFFICLAEIESHFVADNLGEDCPVFEDMFEFCQIYAGATIGIS